MTRSSQVAGGRPCMRDGCCSAMLRPLKLLAAKPIVRTAVRALQHIHCFGIDSSRPQPISARQNNSNTNAAKPHPSLSRDLAEPLPPVSSSRKARLACCGAPAPRFAQHPSSACQKQRTLARSPSTRVGRCSIEPSSIHCLSFVWRVFTVMAMRVPLFLGLASSIISIAATLCT